MDQAQTHQPVPDEGVARALDAKNRAFERHYNAGDALGLVSAYFAPDQMGALASPPGGIAPTRGRKGLVTLFTGMFADAPAIALRTETLVTSKDLAFELGRAFLTLADGTSAVGRFTVCWVCDDTGEWWAKADFFAQDGWTDVASTGLAKSAASVRSQKASNYLQQVCKHWSHRFEAKFDERQGTVDFGESCVVLEADGDILRITVNAREQELEEIENIVAEHIQRFAHREGKLTFAWERL